VRLPDGRIIGLQYAGQNGHNYWAIGRTLKDEGKLEQVTLQTIRAWLYANPEEVWRSQFLTGLT
jgi:membrane-bound lytic murein transglycosylase A